jgi:hypothetical protein
VLSPARPEFDSFQARYFATGHGESQHGSYEVPAVVAAGAGVHVDEAESGVSDYFEDVGVAADEQARAERAEDAASPFVVIAGIASDVGHVDA